MNDLPLQKLVVAVSSSALFDLEKSHQIFEKEGVEAYAHHQIANEDILLQPGAAFGVVQKLLALNSLIEKEDCVEVILLSRNSSDTGLRVFNSIAHHELNISRAAFTSGQSPYRYASAFGAHLFLSTNGPDVEDAIQSGMAAATILKGSNKLNENKQLKIAFDGDAVLFSDQAERVFRLQGLQAFKASEQAAAKQPLEGGPFKAFLLALHQVQARFAASNCPIRTALVTARSAPAHERVVRTLRSWNIRIDESLFLGGMDKLAFLKAFDADIFFDDQMRHIEKNDTSIAAGHVPHGIANKQLDYAE